jgi:hypothetical protein
MWGNPTYRDLSPRQAAFETAPNPTRSYGLFEQSGFLALQDA